MGRLIVIEGLDGSGKATQTALLGQRLTQSGERVRAISFPDYRNPSSTLVKMYLAGEIGSLEEVNAYAASSFYAVDRYVSYQTLWKKDYKSGATILADRYTTSNISHQMVKLPREEWGSYIRWLEEYEYERLGLPKPNMVLYLDMHPEASRRLIEGRSKQTGVKQDIHEQNTFYLSQCREAALYAAGELGWKVISCSDSGHAVRPLDEIASEVYNTYMESR